jgi:UDP-N-acetylglucosamine/UDP-N-acetylgalactosamine diphosphorylase
MIPQSLRDQYNEWGQSHVFKYVDSPELRKKYDITDTDVVEFIQQLKSVEYPRVKALLAQAKADTNETGATAFSAPKSDDIFTLSERTTGQNQAWWNRGIDAIKHGKIAVCILSGGQGTRMGLAPDESKGMLQLTALDSNKFVFQLFIERLLRLRAVSGSQSLPLLIMTSPINNLQVSNFLKKHDFFGYPEKDVFIFKQGTLPALTTNGDLLLESHARLAISPDGNGGIYNALVAEGVMAELEKRGVESLHVIAVDNAIARPADPLFVGACLEAGVEIGNKVVWKSDWKEKVGVIAQKNGKTSVVEYSDLYNPDLGIDNPQIRAVDQEGRLLFGAGNICNHYYSLKGLARILPQVTANYHLAVKKIQSVDSETGEVVKPKSNNGLKLESFIFDAFELANSSIIVEAERGYEFTPMKNASGEDSPETAVAAILASHRQWLTNAGAIVRPDIRVEILPEVSYSGEGLESLKGYVFETDTLVSQAWMSKKH